MKVGMITAALALTASTAALGQSERWVPIWGSAQMRVEGKEADQVAGTGPATIRQIVHVSAGGARVRVRLSNDFGDAPLTIGDAAIARPVAPGRADETGGTTLTFAGARSVTIPAGAEVYSDPVAMPVAAGADLAISLFLPESPAHRTGHPGAHATAFLAPGDAVTRPDLPGAKAIGGWWQLADVEVSGGDATGTVVAIGDSITDGHGVRDNSNARWPDVLAARLQADPRSRMLSVVNAGIGGNRVLLDGLGPNLLARFDRDVVARPAVRYAIILEGVNDIGVLTRDAPASPEAHHRIVSDITGAFRQIAARARAHGIKLIGGTITPYVGSDYYHPGPASEADRQAINAFIRGSGAFDRVVDFDRVVRDPNHPDHLLPAYDSGDHLHPSEAGYRAMGEAVPLSLFGATAESRTAQAGESTARPQIALTFDDMPAHGPLPIGEMRLDIANRIIAALNAHHAAPFGFYNGGFATDPQSPAVLRAWRAAGYPIGNHTWSHRNLADMTAAAFLADIARDEPTLREVMAGADWRWFRYPFLSEGDTPAKREAVRAGLRASGYRIAAVTMSFGDYAWNDAYARCKAKGDGAAISRLEASYLDAARVQALRSRALAQGALGRDIPYVLLMHLGAFDARMLPRLLDLYEELGFRFTSLPEAERDPFYASAVDLSLPGPSPTLEAAAIAKGVPVPANAPLPGAGVCG